MQRVLVIGPCGSGKSTLAFALGKRLDLPVHHLDALLWLPGWHEMERAEYLRHQEEIVAGERWIIDGTHGSSLQLRLPQADTVVYLDFPIPLCLWRIVRRVWTWRGRTRPDMGEDCPERFDLSFLWYVANWNSGPRVRLHRQLEGHWDKVERLRSPRALERWMDSLRAE